VRANGAGGDRGVATTKAFLRDSNGDLLDHAAHSRDKIPAQKWKIIQKNSCFTVAILFIFYRASGKLRARSHGETLHATRVVRHIGTFFMHRKCAPAFSPITALNRITFPFLKI
jgi:hypothetical protein